MAKGKGKPIDVDWLSEHYPTMTCIDELLDDYEREFGWRPARTTVYVKANKLGLRKKPVAGRGNRCERAVYWHKEPEMEAWMLEHDRGQRADELSREFRERYGFGLSRGQINGFRSSHGTGCRRRTSHGGGRPLLPVGTERPSKDGYVIIKVREKPTVPMSKDNWMLKHVWAWEQANGPLPEDHVVYFADRDHSNFDPDNLVAVPRSLVGVINGMGYEWHDRPTFEAIVALARLSVAKNKALAAMVRTCPCCGKTFDNRSRPSGSVETTICPDCGRKGRRPPTAGRRRKRDHDEPGIEVAE